MKSTVVVLLLSTLTGVLCQEFASDCPEPNGFFADAAQCDKYYACNDGVLSEKLCPDGMVFSDFDPRIEKCDFPFHVSCEGRPELQAPHPTDNCPRQNGYFSHKDETICNIFFYCAGGIGSKITCPETLAFSLKTGTCVWPNESGRVNCKSTNLLNFTCPAVSADVAVAHPRYADPDDCQFFFVCINGDEPRHNGCKFGQVFNRKTKSCDQPINVPDCANYYKEYFENYFGNLGENTQALTPDIIAAAVGSGFKLPDKPQRVQIGAKPVRGRPAPAREAIQTAEGAVRQVQQHPVRQTGNEEQTTRTRRPLAGTRRRPQRRRPNKPNTRGTTTTTTTTTTEAPPPEYVYDDYYYYDDAAPAEGAPTGKGAPLKPKVV